MIYLDYSATTPIMYDVLDSYNKASREYIGNVNSLHSLGVKAKNLYSSATQQICELFSIMESELIYTSGATESNNMAFKGLAYAYKQRGNHIIVSKLEHPSIYAICDFLEEQGFEISYVNNDENGLIDFEDLKRKIRPDTLLVSICAVNSEIGVRQPLKFIRQIIKKENPNTFFHSDMTQAIGKVSVNLHDVDLASMSGHKIFGPKGIGFLYKSAKVRLEPLIHGTSKVSDLRAGTTPLPLIVSFAKALRLALDEIDRKENYVRILNEKICNRLQSSYPNLMINKTKYSIPHILNISLMGIKPETFLHALEEREIYISSNTACSTLELSTAVMAVYNDKKRASSTLRISISHITTNEEINNFLEEFDKIYKRLEVFN